METPKKNRKMVPMYSAEDFFSGKKDKKPVGWMSDPDEIGPVLVDRATLERLLPKGKEMKIMDKGKEMEYADDKISN